MSALQPVRVGDALAATVERLATAIRVGAIRAGESLPPERELAAALGVSRVTLREAIAALRAAQMVYTRPGRGGGSVVVYDGCHRVVKRPGGSSAEPALPRGTDLVDVLTFRRVVEPGAAQSAAEIARSGMSPQRRSCLTAALHEAGVAARSVGPVAPTAAGVPEGGFRVADSRLHVEIAAATGSPMLTEAVARGQGLVHRLLAAMAPGQMDPERAQEDHVELVAAVLSGQPDQARQIAREHCDRTAALLLETFA